jgi:hypothetical protein
METRGIDLPLAGRHGGTDKCATGTSPSFAAVPEDGDKPVLRAG